MLLPHFNVKSYTALLCALVCQTWVHAQPAPGPAASTNAPVVVPPDVDKTELMLRRLREALTNPPAGTRSGSAPVQSVPRRSVPAQPAPPAATVPTNFAPVVTEPLQTAPAQVAPVQTAPVQTAPVALPPVQTAPAPGAVPTRPGSTAANRTNLFPANPAATAAVPPVRNLPTRPQINPAGAAGPGMPGAAVPGAAVAAPGLPGAGPGPLPGGPGAVANNPPAVATGLDPNETMLAGTLQFQGMDADQFFEAYSQFSGRTVLRNYTLPVQKITLKAATDLTRQEAVYAMDAALAQNGIAMIPVGDKFVKAVPLPNAPTEGAQLTKAKAADMAENENFITQVIKLEHVKPTDLQQLLSTFSKSPQGITAFDNTQTLVVRDYASNVKRMLAVIESVDVAPKESDYKLEAIPVKYGKVIDLYNTMQSLIAGGGAAGGTTSATGTQGQGMGRMGGGRFGGGGMGSRFGGGGYGGGYGGGGYGSYGSSYGRYGGGYGGGYSPYDESIEKLSPMQAVTPAPGTTPGARSVGAAQSSFQNRLNQIVRRAASQGGEEVQVLEDARIVPDERSNKLLVFASKRDMEMITNIVSKVDVLLAQVLIEAIIMEVNLADSYKLGISWAQQPKSFGGGSSGAGVANNGPGFLNSLTNFPSGAPSGFSYYGTLANDWNVAIQALADNSSIHVVSRPRIQTSHAIPGSFFVGETVPYITGFTDYGGYVGTGLSTSSVIQQANVGFSLMVTPFITPDGLVVMDIAQDFSTRGQDVIINNNPVPIINGRNAESTLTVRDGDTIMMGGFITENRSRDKAGVPFLKDIPGLGALFRSRTDSNNRTELIVLMRARVLRTPEDAAIMATQEKSDLPGIRQAERDLKDANEKRKRKASSRY